MWLTMVDDFIVCVDRIAACACCEPARGSRAGEESGGVKSEDGKMTECRICQEEEEERAMEAPCACSGTLKVFSCFAPVLRSVLCFFFFNRDYMHFLFAVGTLVDGFCRMLWSVML